LTLPDDYYPWWSNTASTANGFLANSSGVTQPFSPAGAQWQEVNTGTGINTRGLYGWWPVIRSAVGSANAPDGTSLRNTQIFASAEMQFMANANCTLWYAPFAERNASGNTDQVVNYDQVGVISLTANVPFTMQFPLTWFEGNQALGGRTHGIGTSTQLTALGWAVRVPDSSARVYVFSGSQVLIYNAEMNSNW
jgi:hypothetical protein